MILLDLIMPGMNGHQTLVALRAQTETHLTHLPPPAMRNLAA